MNMFMDKKFCTQIVIVCLAVMVLSSCTDIRQTDTRGEQTETLREQSESMTKNTAWTSEIEGTILSADIVHAGGITPRVKLTPRSIVAGGDENLVPPLYPSLPGFASLDISKLDPAARSVAELFCSALCAGKDVSVHMAEGCAYSLSFFYVDLAASWKKEFGAVYPLEPAAVSAAPVAADASVPVPVPATAEPAPLFSSFLLGEPFSGNDFYQLPVRFTAATGYIDVTLYLIENGTDWKIDQIQIIKWGKPDDQQ
jgi:hypothetical protein